MKTESLEHWTRAQRALKAAQLLVLEDPDGSASRAYYAAFHAVSAHFCEEDQEFTKHTAIEAAVHRALVRAGRWDPSMGKAFSWLASLRNTGDYGGATHVSPEDAEMAIQRAEAILRQVQSEHPEFPA